MRIVNAHVHMLEIREGDAVPAGIAVLRGLSRSLKLLRVEDISGGKVRGGARCGQKE